MAKTRSVSTTLPAETRKTKATIASSSLPLEPKKSSFSRIILKIVFFLLFAAALGGAGYFYYKYQKAIGADQAREIQSLVKELSRTMELPVDETPTLATVTDKSKLENQPFFKKAENGDKVLIYVKAGKAILYRPSTKKIIDVSMVNISTNTEASSLAEAKPTAASPAVSETSSQTATEERPAIALYNGAKTLGLTYKVEEKLKENFQNLEIIKKDSASNSEYTKTIVVDLSGKHTPVANDIARNLSAEVKNLPSGESRPEADILIIIGEDKAQ